MRKSVLMAILGGIFFNFSQNAIAYEAGEWQVQGGFAQVRPKSNNGSILDNAATLDANNSIRPHIALTYMATPNIGIELLGALPFKHDISLHGAVEGQAVETKQLPPTVSVQYHFTQHETIQPYVGVGLNYTHFFSTKTKGPLAGQEVKIDNSWGLAGQVGVNYHINEKWFVNTEVRYINIKSEVRLNGAVIGQAKINPWVLALGVGYRF